jgi:hypothetical protein
MKLLNIRTFQGHRTEQMMRYLAVDLGVFLKSLLAGHTRLTFGDNFESFTFPIDELAAGAEISIPNRLSTDRVLWFPVRITGDNRLVETVVTNTSITLKNMGAVSIGGIIIVMRF